jgi:16S rRNA (cytosine967-C5)-methyltransferase
MPIKMSHPRRLAYDGYVEVFEQKQRPEDVFERICQDPKLKRLDRAFIKELLYGSLRWHSKIYWILKQTAKRDLDKLSPFMRASLVLGTYQIFYMDKVPDRAAVNESVEYLRASGEAKATSFANGILRQIARKAAYFPKPDKEEKPVEYLAVQFAHPEWMIKRWLDRFSFPKLEIMLAANNTQPSFTARANLMRYPVEQIHDLQQKLLKEESTHTDRVNLRSAIRFLDPPRFDEGSLFARGEYTAQDLSSQLVALFVDPKPGEHIADVCAGPGGKLSHLYELAGGQAFLTAIERSPRQFSRAQESMQRMGHDQNLTWRHQDLLECDDNEVFDKILLDAPCSGLGVLAKHPDGKIFKNAASIEVLAAKQRELILHCLKMLKKGGHLIYSVCSFEPEETLLHVEWLQKQLKDQCEIVSPLPYLPDYYKKYVTREQVFLVYSFNADAMDGFGSFILRKK